MSIKKALIGIGLILLSYILFVLLFSKQSSSPSSDIFEKSQKETTILLSPNPITLTSNEGKVDIIVDTGSNQINFVQVQIFYDPKRLSNIKIAQGPFMQKAQILNSYINSQTGTITYILNLPKKEKSIQGTGSIATITFNTSLKPKQYTVLAFSKETLVTDSIHTDSILKETKGTTIQREN
jgi:hypothetical protein